MSLVTLSRPPMVPWKAYSSSSSSNKNMNAARKRIRAPWESMFTKVPDKKKEKDGECVKHEDLKNLEELLGIEALDSDGDVSVSVAMGIMRNGQEPVTFEQVSTRTTPNKNARASRDIDENKLMQLFDTNPQLASMELDFFHGKAPPLLHLCMFHKASVALIQRVYQCNPQALSTTLFGWLTPLHLAAMRLTCDDLVLRFLVPLYTEDQRCALKTPLLPFVLRRVRCFRTFKFCLNYFDVNLELDHAGNSILHAACHVGDYASIFGSNAYKGCRLDVANYLVHHHPELISRMNRYHQLPLHSLLCSANPPTDLALRLLSNHKPCNAAEALRLACWNGAAGSVVRELYILAGSDKPLALAFGESLGAASGEHQASESAIQFLLSRVPQEEEGILELSDISNLDYYNARALATFVQRSNIHTFRLINSFLCPQGTLVLYRALFTNKRIRTIYMPQSTDFLEDMLKRVMLGTRPALHEAQPVESTPDLPAFVQMLHGWLLTNDHVTHLNFACNRVPDPEIWLKALAQNDTIEFLNLAGMSLKGAGDILVDIVQSNHNLKTLQLECTYLEEGDIIAILNTLSKNRTLQHIALDPESEEIAKLAVQIVKDNIHITQLDFPYFSHRECRDKECNCNVLRPYWRQVQHCCALNRIIQKHLASEDTNNKERFICNVILPSTYSVSMLYGVLRLEPDLWSM